MKKLQIEVNHWIDIHSNQVPKKLLQILRDKEPYTYMDTILLEHLYGAADLLEQIDCNELPAPGKAGVMFLEKIMKLQEKHDAAYFRIIDIRR